MERRGLRGSQKSPLFETRLDLYPKRPQVRDVTLHLRGKEDHEVLACGHLVERAAARAGLETLAEFIPSQDRVGDGSLFKLKVSESALNWLGDTPDLLIDLDSRNSVESRRALPPGAALIYDCSVEHVEESRIADVSVYPVPMANIGKVEVGEAAARGLVGIGATSKLCCFPIAHLEAILKEGRTFHGVSTSAAIRALRAGISYAAAFIKKSDPHLFPVGSSEKAALLLSGAEAGRLGAFAGGCRLFFIDRDLPFSPREEFEGRRALSPEQTVVIDQMNLESLAQVFGVYFSGAKALVETSGNGFEKIQWLLGSSRKARIPLVAIDYQKKRSDPAGPLSQPDLNAAIFAGSTEASSIVMAPCDIRDSLHLTFQAFQLAEKLRMPIFLLSEEALCRRSATVCRTDLPAAHDIREPLSSGKMLQWKPTDLLSSSRWLQGCGWINDRFGPIAWEGDSPAEVGFISWGATQTAVQEAMRFFRVIGFPAAALYPKVLWPPPDDAIKEFAQMVKKVVVVEGNKEGQFAQMVRVFASIKPIIMTPSNGRPITPADLMEKEDWH